MSLPSSLSLSSNPFSLAFSWPLISLSLCLFIPAFSVLLLFCLFSCLFLSLSLSLSLPTVYSPFLLFLFSLFFSMHTLFLSLLLVFFLFHCQRKTKIFLFCCRWNHFCITWLSLLCCCWFLLLTSFHSPPPVIPHPAQASFRCIFCLHLLLFSKSNSISNRLHLLWAESQPQKELVDSKMKWINILLLCHFSYR